MTLNSRSQGMLKFGSTKRNQNYLNYSKRAGAGARISNLGCKLTSIPPSTPPPQIYGKLWWHIINILMRTRGTEQTNNIKHATRNK